MKKIIPFVLFCFMFSGANAQMINPVKWNYTAKKVSDKVYDIYMTAVLDENWHIYAQDAGEGPEPTTIKFSPNPLVKLDGKVKEAGKLQKSFDPNFNSTLRYYSSQVDFIQRIKLKSSASTILKGSVYYMVCDDKKCLPPKEVTFNVKLPAK